MQMAMPAMMFTVSGLPNSGFRPYEIPAAAPAIKPMNDFCRFVISVALHLIAVREGCFCAGQDFREGDADKIPLLPERVGEGEQRDVAYF